jgi:hypothetical protein
MLNGRTALRADAAGELVLAIYLVALSIADADLEEAFALPSWFVLLIALALVGVAVFLFATPPERTNLLAIGVVNVASAIVFIAWLSARASDMNTLGEVSLVVSALGLVLLAAWEFHAALGAPRQPRPAR